ncbi:DUF4012 domain-containing protein [Subtercola endophyticus]|uniref:DUF4012 domain-containing protein n=1 Tax=Subtercola endophyticus TaxID=2895559 RepID=UPI001E61FFFC|nr:DUF4012 domain-containing protein [Subtercola endophyticus]UFS57745.1 DUF4012 domain-containing protein [Subtercola endophyticus]
MQTPPDEPGAADGTWPEGLAPEGDESSTRSHGHSHSHSRTHSSSRSSSGSGRRRRRSSRSRRRRRTVAIVLSSVGVVVLGIVALAGWVAYQTLQAKSDLETAQSSITEIQKDVTTLNVTALPASVATFQSSAQSAASHTNDPVYRLAEGLPVVGVNLTAVRELSGALNDIGTQALPPLVSVASSVTPESLKPVDGKLNVALLSQGDAALASADTAMQSVQASAQGIQTAGTVGQISSAKTQFVSALGKAHDEITKVRGTIGTVENILGMNGTRHYLLAFLNNAETTGLGGGPASVSMLTVDNGSFAITDQASSTDFPLNQGPVMTLDQNLLDMYSPGIASTMNWSTSRPDFPTAAKLIEAYWAKFKGGVTPDGVISIDPIALSYILGATGPMTLASGDVINADNVVSLMLHDIYLRYPQSEIEAQTDVFFADSAKTIFTGITTTKADPTALIDAVSKAVSSGNMMAWSPVDAEQQLVTQAGLEGVIPTDNTKQSMVGVYFRDVSTSKADYWVHSTADMSSDVCTNSQNPTFTTTITLNSTETLEESQDLPEFVTGGVFHGTKIATEVYVYGPVGATLTSDTAGDTSVGATVRSSSQDLGRPVARFEVFLAPGETNTVTATFTGAAGKFGKPTLQVTPMINPTASTVTAAGCK